MQTRKLGQQGLEVSAPGLGCMRLVAEIIPELWLMDHYNVQLSAPYKEELVGDLAVLTAKA